jgi:hypothetical protein
VGRGKRDLLRRQRHPTLREIIPEWWATSSRNSGRNYLGMAGDFIPKSWATSIRIRKRCAGMPIAAPRWPLATLAAPIYLATLPAQGGERARERWSTTCSSLTIPNLIRVLSRFRR